MAARRGAIRPASPIDLAPLVGVALALLAIVVARTPLALTGTSPAPEPEPAGQIVPPSAVAPDQTVLTVLRSGRVLLDRQEMSVEEAMGRLRAGREGWRSRALFFNAEDEASLQLAVAVLEEARRAGVGTIGMVTDPAPVR